VPRGRGVEDDVIERRARRARVEAASSSSKAAISTVHAPESCSSMLRTAALGKTRGTARPIRSRYACAAASGSMFIA
jgi:hypothetical protein